MAKPKRHLDAYDFKCSVVSKETDMDFSGEKLVYAEDLNGILYTVTGVIVDPDGDLIVKLGSWA